MIAQPGRLFRFKLAALLGKTHRELLESMDSVELSEWEAVNRLWPIDIPRRQELSAGIISMLVHNSNAKHAKPASEFMQDWEQREQPAKELTDLPAKIDSIMGLFGG